MTFPLAAPEPFDATDPQADDAAYYRRVLHDFIEMGAELARLVVQDARSLAEAAPAETETGAAPRSGAGADCALAFERISRTVRRSIMLARTLDEPVPAVNDTRERRSAARRRILRAVEDMIPRETGDGGERLDAERRERLDADEPDAAIDPQMVVEILAEICRDLGIAEVPGMAAWRGTAEPGGESGGRGEWAEDASGGEREAAEMRGWVPDG
jgi:hypothetical protein